MLKYQFQYCFFCLFRFTSLVQQFNELSISYKIICSTAEKGLIFIEIFCVFLLLRFIPFIDIILMNQAQSIICFAIKSELIAIDVGEQYPTINRLINQLVTVRQVIKFLIEGLKYWIRVRFKNCSLYPLFNCLFNSIYDIIQCSHITQYAIEHRVSVKYYFSQEYLNVYPHTR